MDGLIHAAILGIVQGLTEFLPISSSAHLILVPKLLGWSDPFLDSAAYDVMLHLGTLLALVVYFWRDLWRLLAAWLRSIGRRSVGDGPDARLAWLLIISAAPAAVLGAALEGFFDRTFRDALAWVAVFILLGAALLWLAEQWGTRDRDLSQMTVVDAAIMGVGQALALFPGMSRSGTTIAAGLFLGLERATAARFSFLMAVPIIAGAGLWKARTLTAAGLEGARADQLLVGVAVSAASGFVAVWFLLAFLRRNSTVVFIAYRLILAGVVFVLLLSR